MANEMILLANDDQDILKTLEGRLISEKFQVTTALSGEIALEKIRKLKPDLIILDLGLPGINGCEVCRILKKDRRYRDIPIIMLIANDRAEDRLLVIEAGANAHITKPYIADELLRKVRRQLFFAGSRRRK